MNSWPDRDVLAAWRTFIETLQNKNVPVAVLEATAQLTRMLTGDRPPDKGETQQ
jgi:hypothetical protein